ncbi:hypothetical protein DSO57_1019698 [Entomophthora muscae]|uniref:Uncharacterized protein n=1 Tax=Entomophthora muscae TaxID=34485 RepID=A0ACC2TSC3_9FUNG|nr:hypothetical protein DSO57_1019698 [Entomophthora muscae]
MFYTTSHQNQINWNGEYSPEEADKLIESGKGAAVSFGRAFIPNPDLPFRMFNNLELAEPIDLESYYVYPENEKHVGYSDYPFHPANTAQT